MINELVAASACIMPPPAGAEEADVVAGELGVAGAAAVELSPDKTARNV
jgi:hypothetical protein